MFLLILHPTGPASCSPAPAPAPGSLPPLVGVKLGVEAVGGWAQAQEAQAQTAGGAHYH